MPETVLFLQGRITQLFRFISGKGNKLQNTKDFHDWDHFKGIHSRKKKVFHS